MFTFRFSMFLLCEIRLVKSSFGGVVVLLAAPDAAAGAASGAGPGPGAGAADADDDELRGPAREAPAAGKKCS